MSVDAMEKDSIENFWAYEVVRSSSSILVCNLAIEILEFWLFIVLYLGKPLHLYEVNAKRCHHEAVFKSAFLCLILHCSTA